ncbi:hypothetical protein B4168_2778 [Anoxybacillus flavithermus]|nr:hypothetical protein B4168_2778 [Anoxybacillus flavithermus]OAO87545.1 hypothetical protein GT23_1194 [Parageobacillus thermoglucosidasius]
MIKEKTLKRLYKKSSIQKGSETNRAACVLRGNILGSKR